MMATKQRASGGIMAKTCPRCGAALWDDGSCLPCDWRRVPGQPARPSGEQPAGQPGDWRRLVTGIIASQLGVLALVLLGESASCDPTAFLDCWASAQLRYAAYSLLVIASPFALATLMPFGTSRRVVVGLGAALLSAAAALIGAVIVLEPLGEGAIPFAWVEAGIAFWLAFYTAYRIAR